MNMITGHRETRTLRKTWATIAAIVICAGLAQAAMRVSEKEYTHQEATSKAHVIENDWYAATLVPSRGGRILEWFDKKAERALIYDNGYGGLLDDHGSRLKKPYVLKWLKRTPGEVSAQLTLEDGEVVFQKTVQFFADRPAIRVTYHLENHGQAPSRLLFRNVVRPGGTAFTGKELYCYSRVVGLQRGNGMPRTDDQADPWCALVDPARKSIVAAVFEGDALERLYTWRGSKVAPTFEFMFNQLKAGRQMDVTYYWLYGHGLTAADYAHRNVLVQMEGVREKGTLLVNVDILATWAPMPDLKISGQLLDPNRKAAADIPAKRLPVKKLDDVVRLPLKVALPADLAYAILVLRLESSALDRPIEIEKPFPRGGNARLLEGYRRPVRWIGKPVVQRAVPGWEKEVKYVIRPDDVDRKRGSMVFEETGQRAGKRASAVQLDLAQQEPEAFPLHFHSLTRQGDVAISVQAPQGLSIETFVPEDVPEKLWGRVLHGLKLNPGNTFPVKPKDDRVLYFRLRAKDPSPGLHKATITFSMAGMVPLPVAVNVKVYPVRFPRHPYMVFDVNNVVNYLCAQGKTYEWAPVRARNYLTDMETHGVRTQTMVGMNAPSSAYWYNRVKVRPDGVLLTEAIKREPQRFRGSLELPPLDFSYWDPMIDWLIEHGQARLKWPMGGCHTGFMARHSKLTQLVYGRTFPLGDLRDMALKEWYFRELGRYLRDRGITRILVTIDDEIPSEKLAWWVQHADRCIQMGLEPGVTQSAKTIADNTLINMLAPFMKYWIIGTLYKPDIDLRRKQGIIRPEHWVTTYHSSANHWRPYDQTRGYCGLNSAFFDLDACWIQVYWRWRQSEAIIYPGKDGPISSAAWEGARDGLDDGNYLLLARSMIAALPARDARDAYAKRLEAIVGMSDKSLIRFTDRISSVGMVTTMGEYRGKIFKAGYDTARFRQAKRQLLDLVVELSGKVPAQKASADFGLHPLIRDGRCVFALPAGMKRHKEAVAFLKRIAAPLALEEPKPERVDPKAPYPAFFLGTLPELAAMFPVFASRPELADLSDKHPAKGTYAIRFVRRIPNLRKKERAEDMPESMLILGGDDAGIAKAMALLPNVVTQPKSLYSHWILAHKPGH